MDTLSIAAGIGSLLTISVKLMSVGYSYGSSVKDFPQELQDLMAELQSLSTILTTLSIIYSPAPTGTARKSPVIIDPFGGALEACSRCLKDTFESLEKYNSGNRLRMFFKRITWPLDEGDTQELFKRLDRYKSTFSLAISSYDTSLRLAMHDGIEELNNHQTAKSAKKESAMKNKRFRDIIRWLSSADPQVNHLAARKIREDGTGKWFTEGKAYQDWFLAESAFLWLYGKPGAGKTVLSSITIDNVMSEISTNTKANATPVLIYFYCDFKDSSKQTADSLLGSLIAQLVREKSEIPERLETLYRDQFDEGCKPPNAIYLEECLASIVKEFSKVVIIIDALDECMIEERDHLCKRLMKLFGQGNINILVLSRDEPDIREEFSKLPTILIKDEDVSVDIEIYVTNEISRQSRLNKLKPSTKSNIISTLVNEANGMFRWASCCLDEIIKLRTDKSIKAALKSLPPTLEQSYERILCNIDERDKTLAIRVFQWLLFSHRPMSVWEVVDAIAVELGDTSMDPEGKLNDPGDISNICGGLVKLDQRNMTLGLAHFTVKEYLLSASITRGPAAAYQIHLQLANAELAKTCLTYVLFDDFAVGDCNTQDEFDARLREYPFLPYAVHDWPKHVTSYQTSTGTDETLDELILSFFLLDHDCGKFFSWLQCYLTRETRRVTFFTNTYTYRGKRAFDFPPVTPLHFATEMNQIPAISELFKRGVDINTTCNLEPWCGTPLVVATRGGSLDMMKFLLERGADPNKSFHYPPMIYAARKGFAEGVQLLLSHGGESGGYDLPYGDALCDAFLYDNESVVDVILETDQGKWLVSSGGAETEFFKLILIQCVTVGMEKTFRRFWDTDWGADFLVDRGLLTGALIKAIACGHSRLVRIITQNDKAKAVCIKDESFCVMLQEAAYMGSKAIVELLLGLRKDVPGGALGVALNFAAANGHAHIIEYLISVGADPRYKDDHGWSPLLYASEYEEAQAVETLSAIENVPGSLKLAEVMGPTSWQTAHKRLGLEVSTDGLEVRNVNTKPRVTIEANYSTIPLNLGKQYSFEVNILGTSKSGCYIAIGFADAMYFRQSLWQPQRPEERLMFEEHEADLRGSGSIYTGMTWGFCNTGDIIYGEDFQEVRRYAYDANNTVGCHFNGTENVAFFTLNGEVVGKYIAHIKGKLVPIVSLGPGAHIRANFGDGPLTYAVPDLSTEMVRDAWEPQRDLCMGLSNYKHLV